jgi:Mrp family chromosome partitioning ATPase
VLNVVVSGALPPTPGEFVWSFRFAEVLSRLSEQFDVVIIDSAPLLGLGDALALTAQVDGYVLVARLELLRRPMLAELRRTLAGCPARPLGIVVTAAERESSYGYGYGYSYGVEAPEDRAAAALFQDRAGFRR